MHGHPTVFHAILVHLGSILDPKTDIKMSCFFSSIFVMILMDLGLFLGVFLKEFRFRNGSIQVGKNLKKRDTFVKIKGLGIYGHSKNHEKTCPRSR